MIEMSEENKKIVRELRDRLYAKRENGVYDKESEDWINLNKIIDNFYKEQNITKDEYIFDAWTGVAFTKQEQKEGKIREYRKSMGFL